MDDHAAELPPLYAPWVRALLGVDPPAERHATCARCALCEGGGLGERPVGRVRAHPQVKCCAYRPALPNFLVGSLLADPASERGQVTLRARLQAAPHEATPLGVGRVQIDPPPLGAGPEHACPHLDDGECSIWRHRHATCATWWCKHERGAVGQEAWHALRALLLAVEDSLALWCCLQEGLPGDALMRLVAFSGLRPQVQLHGASRPDALWGPLVGHEEAFYRRCHARVRALTWPQVLEAGGPQVRALAEAAKHAFHALSAPLPDRLRVGTHRVVAVGVDGVMVETYRGSDPVLLPAMLQAVLYLFDGRETAQILAQLEQEQGLSIDAALLRELVDFEVLVPAEASA